MLKLWSCVWLAVVRTCFVSDLQRGFKIQDAKFNLEGTADVSELSSTSLSRTALTQHKVYFSLEEPP